MKDIKIGNEKICKICEGCNSFVNINGYFACIEVYVRLQKTSGKKSPYVYSIYRDNFCPCKECLVKCQCDHVDEKTLFCPFLIEAFVKYEEYLRESFGEERIHLDKHYTQLYELQIKDNNNE